MPASQIPVEGFTHNILPSSSGPVEVDDIDPDPMEIESLDNSPGNTLRTARRGIPEVASLAASPGARRRVDASRLEDAPGRGTPTPTPATPRLEAAPPRVTSNSATNGHPRMPLGQAGGGGSLSAESRPTSPLDRPSSRQNTVEITLTGRSRSRQDLCPDRPRSKFEHAV